VAVDRNAVTEQGAVSRNDGREDSADERIAHPDEKIADAAYPLSVEVRDLHKRFRLPGHRPETLKERTVHPFRKVEAGELKVLDGISFDVRQGEFFGVAGRNGSGKSTLLKLLASIYRTDSGTIRIAGSLAPVIELGVGFKPELAARDNIVLNGIMMGMTEAEAEARCDPVIEFAELQDFLDLKLKNYSSGMRVRLAFATMIQAEADILLLDEVLAVGDPSFQEKCEEVFRDLRSDGRKTMILVSNQVAKLERYCDRAILIENGKIVRSGSAGEVADEYRKVIGNNRGPADKTTSSAGRGETPTVPLEADLKELRVERKEGDGPALDQGEEIQLQASAVARQEIRQPGLRIQIRDEDNIVIFRPLSHEIIGADSISPGQAIPVEAVIENRLAPGRYSVICVLTGHRNGKPARVSPIRRTEFSVRPGRSPTFGLVSLEHEVRVGRQLMDAEGTYGDAHTQSEARG
jgi:ABC-2 type transport system ATP-binding protein